MTLGYLKTMLNRFGNVNKVPLRAILEHWQGIDLAEDSLYQICLIGGFLRGDRNCDFYHFLAIACGFLANLLTEEPKGGSAMICLRTFLNLYGYLANLDCSGEYLPIMKEQNEEEIIQPTDDHCHSYLSPSILKLCKCSDSTMFCRKNICQVSQENIHEIIQEEEEEEKGKEDKKVEEEMRQEELDYSQVPDRYSSEEQSEDLNLDEFGGNMEQEEEEEKEEMEESGERVWYQMESMENYSGEFVDAFSDVCTCPKREQPEHIPTAPTPSTEAAARSSYDPVEEFIKRMETEIEKGRLKRIFRIDGIGPVVSEKQVTAVGIWLVDCARRQEGLVGPRNIKHFLCPDLQVPNSDCQSR
ncbi:uncharacterized protein LOC122522194 [Polistes fuscatus]|uniref:uncharacterized protein LOC122522194 n=1 Tax=Polistes fuscatus TaxID=30207 RepID=UPI001CAA3D08|nr:uncharacterized protein LOC122522194 [Polistes fuscatus]